jgi:hypothetical protein
VSGGKQSFECIGEAIKKNGGEKVVFVGDRVRSRDGKMLAGFVKVIREGFDGVLWGFVGDLGGFWCFGGNVDVLVSLLIFWRV